jgi:glutathione synthase/RimK-type ligase-like ATP-grasp enzyme
MKERIWMVFNSVRNKINFEDRKYCFEIFGFDFILDDEQEVWLIEVNTNPCIEESSPLLKMYIPRMLDDAFKLTLDVLFPNQ